MTEHETISHAEQLALQASLLPRRARVNVTTNDNVSYQGRLLGRTDYDIEVLVKGREYRFPYNGMSSMYRVPSWFDRNVASWMGL